MIYICIYKRRSQQQSVLKKKGRRKKKKKRAVTKKTKKKININIHMHIAKYLKLKTQKTSISHYKTNGTSKIRNR